MLRPDPTPIESTQAFPLANDSVDEPIVNAVDTEVKS
jgi:hypothetical protein